MKETCSPSSTLEMSTLPEHLSGEYVRNFENAREAIIFAREATGEWPVPCFNELRYAARHILNYHCLSEHDEKEVSRAAGHLMRAKKDAIQYVLLRMTQMYKHCVDSISSKDAEILPFIDAARQVWHKLPDLAVNEYEGIDLSDDVKVWADDVHSILAPIKKLRDLNYARRFMSQQSTEPLNIELNVGTKVVPSSSGSFDMEGFKKIYDCYVKLEAAITKYGVKYARTSKKGHLYAGTAGFFISAYIAAHSQDNKVTLSEDDIFKYCGLAYYEFQLAALWVVVEWAKPRMKKFKGKEFLFAQVEGTWRYHSEKIAIAYDALEEMSQRKRAITADYGRTLVHKDLNDMILYFEQFYDFYTLNEDVLIALLDEKKNTWSINKYTLIAIIITAIAAVVGLFLKG